MVGGWKVCTNVFSVFSAFLLLAILERLAAAHVLSHLLPWILTFFLGDKKSIPLKHRFNFFLYIFGHLPCCLNNFEEVNPSKLHWGMQFDTKPYCDVFLHYVVCQHLKFFRRFHFGNIQSQDPICTHLHLEWLRGLGSFKTRSGTHSPALDSKYC